MSKKRSSKTVTIHAAAQQAVNTPPSRNPVLMRHLYDVMYRCRTFELSAGRTQRYEADALGLEATMAGALAGILTEDILTVPLLGEKMRIALGAAAAKQKVTGAAISRNAPRGPLVLECASEDDVQAFSVVTQISLSAGVALIRQARQEPGVVLALCGDTFTLRESREGLRVAAAHKLPLVIVTEHNMARKATSRHPRSADLANAARTYGVPGMTVDGSDVMAVYRVTQEALYRARHNGGATVVECKTWRPAGKKPLSAPPARLRHWVQGDALAYMERQLKARGFWDEEWAKQFSIPE